MIRVDRSAASEPGILKKQNQRNESETDRAIQHYTIGWDGEKGFSFSRYKEDAVKNALRDLFSGKCAYCESDTVCII